MTARPISIPGSAARGHHPYAPPPTPASSYLSNSPLPNASSLSQTYHVHSLASSAPSNQQPQVAPRRPSVGAVDKSVRRPRRNSETKRLRGASANGPESLGLAVPNPGSTVNLADKDAKNGIFACENCGKQYRHPSCLVKHRWEHTVYWKEASKFLLSKHQQVQLLEAAAILVNMEGSSRSPGTPTPLTASSPSTAAGWMGPPDGAFVKDGKTSLLSSSFSQFRSAPVFDEEEEENHDDIPMDADRTARDGSTALSSENTESVKNEANDVLDDEDMAILGKMEA